MPAPMDGVPYPQPLAGPEPQYVPWGVLLVRPIGHPPRPVPPRAADQRSRAYPTLLRVLRWGRYGHRGGPQTPEVGSLAGAPRRPFSSRPPFRCAVCGGWCPVSPGWGGGGGGGGCSLFLAVLLAGVSPPPLVLRWWCVVCGVWCAVVVCWRGCGWCVVWLVPRHSWRRFLCATPRHSWLGFAAGGGGRSPPLLAGVRWRRWCVACGGGVLVVGPSPLLAEVPVCYSPPLLAGFRCRRWCVVCGVWCAACGVRRRRVWWVCGWCGWSLATPGGGSCVLLPATPGWVSLPVEVGGPCHSWLGSAGGGGVWCVAVVCWLLVPRHSWRRFLCATPRHSWLGFAAGGGGRSPPLLAGVRWRRWCVVCGGGVLVVGPSPLLAEVPVCYSPPLLAGFRCRRWCVVCGVWCAACGVRRWRVWWVCGWCGWSLATPGGGSCVLLPATPGWVSLPVVVGGPRHSWLGSAGGGGVWCVAVVCWLLVPRHSWRRFLCATPRHSWLGFAAGGGGRSPPLLAGVRWRRWCVVCGGGVLVVGPSPLLAEVPVCYSPPLLAGFRCRRWCVVCGVWCAACGVRRAAVACVVGLWLVWLVPRHSWRRFLCATPRHSWLGFAAGGGGRSPPLLAGVRWRRWCVVCGGGVLVVGPSPLLAEVPVCYSPPLLAGFRCRRWCVVCGVWCAACGVRRWRVWWVCGWCGWSLATPGGGSCVLLPATPGWVSLPVVVGGPRHSWLGSAGGGGVWCVAVVCWLLVPRHSWRRFLCATPRHSWLGFAAGGGGRSPPLLAGVRWRRWCVVCGGGVLVVGPSPLLAGFRCRRWCVVCGVWCAACGVRRWRVWWVCG